MNACDLICHSDYVQMPDQVNLAVSVWLPVAKEKPLTSLPAILTTTRYWRSMACADDKPEFQFYHPHAVYFHSQDYRFVVADARGTGASFGSRTGEITAEEVDDIAELIAWVAAQPWCDGRVATNGTSYTANTTLHSLASGQKALKLGVCRAPDFDLYRHLMAPGGIVNHWFIDNWGAGTAAQDANDYQSPVIGGYWDENAGGRDNVRGVRPVDSDPTGDILRAAVADHAANVNVRDRLAGLTYADADSAKVGSNAYFYQQAIEQHQVPLVIRCGWHDAATALGALSLFCTFNTPVRVILGPWSHTGGFRIDPFRPGDGKTNDAIPLKDEFNLIADSLAGVFENGNGSQDDQAYNQNRRAVEYYTLGENRWKTTTTWPLPQTKMQRLYLSGGQQLSDSAPINEEGSDFYRVDPTASSGVNNRWGCQMKLPVFFDDRAGQDKKRLVYDSAPLRQDTEITGHPLVKLFVRSSATDGQFFAYLETIDQDGRVRWLTDGQLRALHRKVSKETPPFKMFGPYHSFKETDAMPLVPGEVTEISFDLLPISVQLKKGQRIRLAIAGADSDIFAPIPGCENPELTLERNAVYGSFIDLPIVEQEK